MEFKNNLDKALSYYFNTESKEAYERIFSKISDAIVTLIAWGVLINKDNALIEILKEYHPSNIK